VDRIQRISDAFRTGGAEEGWRKGGRKGGRDFRFAHGDFPPTCRERDGGGGGAAGGGGGGGVSAGSASGADTRDTKATAPKKARERWWTKYAAYAND
jgi:hypothetical protein